MKKIFPLHSIGRIVIIGILIFIVSCKKSSPATNGGGSSSYYMQFKANGEQKMYKSEVLAEIAKPTSDGVYSCGLQGYKDYSQGTKDELAIILLSMSPIAVTTYADPEKAVKQDGSILPVAVINYNDPDGTGFLSLGVLADANGTVAVPNVKADAKVTISEIGSNYVKGTFSGTTYKATDGTYSTTTVVTEGEFFLPLAK